MVALICGGFGISNGIADPSPQKDTPQPMLIADLQRADSSIV